MKIIVCGGRDFWDWDFLDSVLNTVCKYDYLPHPVEPKVTHIIHGGARGADSMAGEWARQNDIKEVVCQANWERKGRVAGIERNWAMLRLLAEGDQVIAFPGGKGTAHMVKIAKE